MDSAPSVFRRSDRVANSNKKLFNQQHPRNMQIEDQMCEKYVAELAAIGRLDLSYYLKPEADRRDRHTYDTRKILLEQLRFEVLR